jgi:hypothetical protein
MVPGFGFSALKMVEQNAQPIPAEESNAICQVRQIVKQRGGQEGLEVPKKIIAQIEREAKLANRTVLQWSETKITQGKAFSVRLTTRPCGSALVFPDVYMEVSAGNNRHGLVTFAGMDGIRRPP